MTYLGNHFEQIFGLLALIVANLLAYGTRLGIAVREIGGYMTGVDGGYAIAQETDAVVGIVADVLVFGIEQDMPPVDMSRWQDGRPASVAHDADLDDSAEHVERRLVHQRQSVGVHDFLIDGKGGGAHVLMADGVGGDGVMDLFGTTVPAEFGEVCTFQSSQQDDGVGSGDELFLPDSVGYVPLAVDGPGFQLTVKRQHQPTALSQS